MNFNELIVSLEMGLIYASVVIGIYLTFRTINFTDLTCDGSFVLGMAVSGIMIKNGFNPWVALFFASLAGGLAGIATGILNVCFKISDLLSGILVSFMLYSINIRIMGGIPNISLTSEQTVFSQNNTFCILFSIAFVIWITLGYVFMTDWGLSFRSIGQNKRLAGNLGINSSIMTMFGLIASNSFIALGGSLFCQHEGFADVTSGTGTIIIGLAAIVIGESILPFRSHWISIFACIIGSIAYRIFVGLALHTEFIGLETHDLSLITGIIVIIVMLLSRRRAC